MSHHHDSAGLLGGLWAAAWGFLTGSQLLGWAGIAVGLLNFGLGVVRELRVRAERRRQLLIRPRPPRCYRPYLDGDGE